MLVSLLDGWTLARAVVANAQGHSCPSPVLISLPLQGADLPELLARPAFDVLGLPSHGHAVVEAVLAARCNEEDAVEGSARAFLELFPLGEGKALLLHTTESHPIAAETPFDAWLLDSTADEKTSPTLEKSGFRTATVAGREAAQPSRRPTGHLRDGNLASISS